MSFIWEINRNSITAKPWQLVMKYIFVIFGISLLAMVHAGPQEDMIARKKGLLTNLFTAGFSVAPFPVCSPKVAKKAVKIYEKCAACVDAVLHERTQQIVGKENFDIFKDLGIDVEDNFGIDLDLFVPKCPPGCCAMVNFADATGHFIACHKGCCIRLVSLQVTDFGIPQWLEYSDRTTTVVNNENRVSLQTTLRQDFVLSPGFP